MDLSENTGLLIKALKFSAEKHRNQRRKDLARSPYINHPIGVMYLLWEVGGVKDTDVLVAALLHDTIEDTQTSPDEIDQSFGHAVLSFVLEVTDDKRKPKAEQRRLQIEHAPHLSHGARLIKLADKCCNVHDLTVSPPKFWSTNYRREYLEWTERVVVALGPTNRALEAYYEREVISGKKALGFK